MSASPAEVDDELKLVLGHVLRTPELRAEVRDPDARNSQLHLREAARGHHKRHS